MESSGAMALRRALLLLLLCLLDCSIRSASLNDEITKENWDEVTDRKSVFLMFHAPWCEQCKKDKPAFKKLMKEFKGHKDILVDMVDCTEDSKELCTDLSIISVPTYLYGDPNFLETYSGNLDAESLKAFVKKELKLVCGPQLHDLCSPKEKKMMDGFMKMPLEDLARSIDNKTRALKQMTWDLAKLWKELQEKYDEAEDSVKAAGEGTEKVRAEMKLQHREDKLKTKYEKKEKKVAKERKVIQEAGFSLMKQVFAIRTAKHDEL
mmetsp:Transcript_7380/g.18527  ORF Transcript_7380/g.18527 Transcript_7380/m.18527 type:complete len:265 (-) Transcript_7380:231-1025(-)